MTPDRCRTCRYAVWVDVGLDQEMLRACTYILRHGMKRPCPPGEECTVYKPRRRKGDGE